MSSASILCTVAEVELADWGKATAMVSGLLRPIMTAVRVPVDKGRRARNGGEGPSLPY